MTSKLKKPFKPSFETPLQAEQAFYLALVRKDIKLMQRVWVNSSSSYCLHPEQQPVTGTVNIINSWQNFFKKTQTAELKIEHQKVTNTAQIAIHKVTQHLTILKDKNSKQLATIYAMNVFQYINNNWLLISHHASSAPKIIKPQGTVVH